MKKLYFLILFALIANLVSAQTIRRVKPGGTGDGSTWALAGDLQTMINASASGDQVWVATGTYKPTIAPGSSVTDRDKTFLLKTGVGIYGGFAGTETLFSDRSASGNLTILSGDLGTQADKTDNAYHVVVGTGDLTGTKLERFTITLGYASGSSTSTINTLTVNQGRGGGLYLGTSTGATFENLIITENENATAGQNGGAAYFLYGSGTFTNVEFSNNKSIGNGAAIYMLGLNVSNVLTPTFTNVKFTNNSTTGTGDGGAVYFSSFVQSTFTNSIFDGNDATGGNGGAIYSSVVSSTVTCTNTLFTNNKASSGTGGVMYNSSGSPTFTNCRFIANYASSNGSVFYFGGTSTATVNASITNCLFANNTANGSIYGGAIYNSTYTNTVIKNSTFYGNINSNASNTNNGGAISFFKTTSTTPQALAVYNSIFTANSGDFYNASFSGVITARYNLVQAVVAAPNVSEANIVNAAPTPLFMSTNVADANFLKLVEGAATEKGNNTLAAGISLDLDGNIRIKHTNVDLGAYEYQGVLPVEFLYFNAVASGNNSLLTWKTATEKNSQKFVIERGTSLNNFTVIKEVTAAGNSSDSKLYSFTDRSPASGTNYYRLTQYDNDGTAYLLDIKSVNFSLAKTAIKVYPNPAVEKVAIRLTELFTEPITVNLISLTGKTVLTKSYTPQELQQEVSLNLANIPAGAYILAVDKGKAGVTKQTLLVVK